MCATTIKQGSYFCKHGIKDLHKCAINTLSVQKLISINNYDIYYYYYLFFTTDSLCLFFNSLKTGFVLSSRGLELF